MMRTIKLTIAATETHCERNGVLCGFLESDNTYPLCRAFGGASGWECARERTSTESLKPPLPRKAAQPKQKKEGK